MDVAFVITSLSGGGAERVLSSLAANWTARGISIAVITLAESDRDAYPLPDSVRRIELNCMHPSHNLVHGVYANIARIRTLRRTFKELSPTLVVSFLTECNILSLIASVGIESRIIISERTHPPRHATPLHWTLLRRWLYRYADHVVAQTQRTAEWLRHQTGSNRVVVIPNAANWPLPVLEPIVPVSDYLAEDRFLLLTVGRLDVHKGFDELLCSFASISETHPMWQLIVIGTAGDNVEYANQLRKRPAQLGIEQRVSFPGHVGNMSDWYSRCDMFVLNSHYEGFPNVLLEAMTHGCCVVSVDCEVGPSDMIDHGVSGILVPSGDENAMAAVLDQMISDTALREKLSIGALSVRQKYSKKRIDRKWHSLTLLDDIDQSQHRSPKV